MHNNINALALKNMINNQILANGIKTRSIVNSIKSTPRELFLPNEYRYLAYSDANIHYGHDNYLMSPLIFSQLLEWSDIKPNHKILVLNCGLGYSLAVISKLCKMVTGISNREEFINQSYYHIKSLNLSNITINYSEHLIDGYKQNCPYDVVIIEGAISRIPENLFHQIKHNGYISTIFREKESSHILGEVVKIYKKPEDNIFNFSHSGFKCNLKIIPEFKI